MIDYRVGSLGVTDTPEWQHKQNIKGSDKLLALLMMHHTDAVEELLPPAVITPPERRKSAIEKWSELYERDGNGSRPTVNDIKQCVSAYFGVPVTALESARRKIKIVLARQTAMYLARELTPRSFPEIGRIFGGRDHTTVIHACNRTELKARSDPSFAYDVATLEAMFQ